MGKKVLAGLISFMWAMGVLAGGFSGSSVANAASNYATVRVKLSNANDGTLNITLNGRYTLDKTSKSVSGEVQIKLVSDSKMSLVQKSNGTTLYTGSTFKLLRDELQQGESGLLRMYTTANGWRYYLGDFEFICANSKFTVINHLSMEHYLYGVVAYEMNDNFPLEALKAQAVAARGYAAGRIGTYKTYDLGDTPSDQVYKGFDSKYQNVVKAVDATRGQVLTSNGKIILPYYGASNGGQTELTGNIWNESLSYYPIKDDPYDLRNGQSLSQKIFFPETVSQSTPLDEKLGEFLKVQVAPELQNKGYSTYSDQIEILGISGLTATDSKYPSPSRSYTKAQATVKVRAVQGSGNGMSTAGQQQGTKPVKPQFTYIGESTSGPMYTDANGALYDALAVQMILDQYEMQLADWEKGTTELASSGQGMIGTTDVLSIPITFTIYDLKDSNKPYRLFNNDNLRMYWSEQTTGGANLVNVRYGHGVGMSQRGAEQMANEGKTYREILNFYYANVTLSTASYETDSVTGVTTPGTSADNGSASEDQALEEVAEPDTVTGTAMTSVNLYSSMGANKAVAKLKSGAVVNVLAQSGDWVLIATKAGKVYCTLVEGIAIQGVDGVMRAAAALKTLPENGAAVEQLAKGAQVEIVERSNGTYLVRSEAGNEGYLAIKSVSVVVDNPQLKLSASDNYGQAKQKLTIYSDKAQKKTVSTITKGYVFIVKSKTSDGKLYSVEYNGKKGYVSASGVKLLKKGSLHPNPKQVINQYIKTSSSQSNALAAPVAGLAALLEESDPAPAWTTLQLAAKTVQTSSVEFPGTIVGVTVNLRKSASADSKVITQLAQGEKVSVLGKSGSFYKLRDQNGNVGFASQQYVEVDVDSVGLIIADGVNVRKSANTTSAIVAQLVKGDTVMILSSSGSFFQVKTSDGKTGYVSDQYCKRTAAVPELSGSSAGSAQSSDTSQSSGSSESSSSKNSAQTTGKAAASGVITGGNVNLRESASGSAKVLAVIPKGTRINIYSRNGNYYKVKFNGIMGYVLMSYIPDSTLSQAISESTSTSTSANTSVNSASSEPKLGKVKSNALNVRSSAGIKIATLQKGEIVQILSSSGSKFKIKRGDVVGFVEDQYLTVLSLKKGTVLSSGLNLREQASAQSNSLGVIGEGDSLYIIDQSGEWLRVYADGQVGYVLAKHIDR